MAPDDRDLIARSLAGDQAACTALVEAYSRMIGTLIWRTTGDPGSIEDLAQETFLRVFRGLRHFDARAKLSTWICTIAHRVAIDHLRRSGALREVSFEDTEGPSSGPDSWPSAAIGPEAFAIGDQEAALVSSCLQELPDKYRVCLEYAAIQEMDYATIGTMLGVPQGTVKTLVFRGKRLLRTSVAARLSSRAGTP